MIDLQKLLDSLHLYLNEADDELVKKAYLFALEKHGTQVRASGDPYFSHPVAVAYILTEMQIGQDTVIAGLLHDTIEDTDTTLEEIQENFGDEIAKIVDGVTKLASIENLSIQEKQAENFKKLLLHSSKDIRVLIIKLVDRIHNMRTIRFKPPEKRVKVSKETLAVYAPLAERIGMAGIKDELEDLSFKEVYPEIYEPINEKIENLYQASELNITTICEKLKKRAEEIGITAQVRGRIKTIYSIWQKMNKRNISFDQLSDIMAFRVVVETVPQCYKLLSHIHKNYFVVPGRFRDYIDVPKSNRYQSLHSSVIGPLNKRIEIQIRTKEMHGIAEYGVASHWYYKQNTGNNFENSEFLETLANIVSATDNLSEFLKQSHHLSFVNQVFAVSPQGSLITLPKNSTVLDFAYAIHSDVGNHAIGAIINNEEVSLNRKIENGDQIQIITNENAIPSLDRLRYVITPKAKSALQKCLHRVEDKSAYELGRSNAEEYLRSSGGGTDEGLLKNIADALGFGSTKALLISIGHFEVTMHEFARAHDAVLETIKKEADQAARLKQYAQISGIPTDRRSVIKSKCCSPIPGDRIFGLIPPNNDKIIEIHREDCLKESEKPHESIIKGLTWAKEEFKNEADYLARLNVSMISNSTLLSKIADIFAQKEAGIVNLTIKGKADNISNVIFDTKVRDVAHLASIQAALRLTEGVYGVVRAL